MSIRSTLFNKELDPRALEEVKGNKELHKRKGEVGISFIWRWHHSIYKRPERLHQKTLRADEFFQQCGGHKINTWTSVASWSLDRHPRKNGINNFIYSCIKNNKIPWKTLTERMKESYHALKHRRKKLRETLEDGSVFVDYKTWYCEDDHVTKSNEQIQCIPC